MHIRAVLLLLVFLILPVPAAADFVSLAPSSSCPKGTAGDPTGPAKSFSLSASATEIRTYLYKRVVCPSACFDELVTLNVSPTGISAKVAAQNKCKVTEEDPEAQDAKKDNRGCSKGQTNPRVVVKITGLAERVIPPKSRCDTSNLTGVINSLAQQDYADAFKRLSTLESPLVGAATPAPINLETVAGQKTLAGQLATAFQITPEEAQTIVAKDPEAALRAIYAVAQGDTEAVKAEAEALGLNPNLTDRVALNAKLTRDGGLTEPDGWEIFGGGDNTFGEAVRGAVADTLAPLCGQLGGCSDTACQNNPGSLTCRTNNPGALTWAPWEAKYGGQPCGERNNTACFPSLEHGLAAKIDLITGSRYLGGENNTILRMLCNGYAPNSDGNNCASYATFVQNQTGIPMNQTIDPKNPDQVGRIAMAMARMENGRFVPFTPQQLENAMAMVNGGTVPAGTPGFVARTLQGTNGGTQFSSPFNYNSSAVPANIGYGSAFGGGGGSPAPIAQPMYSQPQSQSAATPVSQPVSGQLTPSQTQTTTSGTSSVAQQLEDALKDPSANSSAARSPVTLVAQPKEVRRGNPITVSWTSIGLSADSPCVLRADSTVIAEGNTGTKTVPTTGATRLGSMIFTLKCTTPSGTTFQRTAAVMVR